MTFFVFGMTVGIAGPTLLDFLVNFFPDCDAINVLSWLLFAQAATRFVGAMTAGYVIDR